KRLPNWQSRKLSRRPFMSVRIVSVTIDEQTGAILGVRSGGSVVTGVTRVEVSKGVLRVEDHAGRNLLPGSAQPASAAAVESEDDRAVRLARLLGFEGDDAPTRHAPAQASEPRADDVPTWEEMSRWRADASEGDAAPTGDVEQVQAVDVAALQAE